MLLNDPTSCPALEYSIFPYDEATRRSLTAFYEIGPAYYDYMELTQDEVLEETRFQEGLSLEFSQRQTWGDASVSVRGSHYLHDFDRNNLQLSGDVSFRILRGFDVNFGGVTRWWPTSYTSRSRNCPTRSS